MLTSIVITKNEEAMIEDCLISLKFSDELIVVDSGNTDKTNSIAKKYHAKIVKSHGTNFSQHRNVGLSEALGEWLLYIDADERVTPALRDEITATIGRSNNEEAAWAIPRKNILLGKEMRWGGWSPDYVLRLIKKSALKTWLGEVHEQPQVEGRVGKLTEKLVHISHRSLTHMVDKTNDWSIIEARLLYESGHPQMTGPRFISALLREFWDRGVKKQGFRDGTEGIIEVLYQVFNKLVVYSKLWELQLK